MKLLLINSNEPNSFAALYDGGELLISYVKDLPKPQEILPRVKPPDLLIDCLDDIICKSKIKGIGLSSIDTISVVTGPGSFTGIRVGLSIAKGFAGALNKKIIPIDNFTLTLNRLASIENDRTYCVVIPAKLPEYYYRIIENMKEIETGFFFPDEITSKINENTVLVGDFNDESQLNVNYFSYINVKNFRSEADSMLELSLRYFKEGKAREPYEIVPLYIKDFVAKKKQI